jgi:hypothetical protein
MTDKEAMKLAKILENIEDYRVTMTAAYELRRLHFENKALKERLAQPAQEPVGFVQQSVLDWLYSKHRFSSAHTITTIAKSPTETEDVAIYTTPPAAQRKPLTDEQVISKALHLSGLGTSPDVLQFARAIEAAHGIKENT